VTDLPPEAKAVRDGLFSAPSRTYGEQYMEPFLRAAYGLDRSGSGDFDAMNTSTEERYEIKTAKALTRGPIARKGDSLLTRILAETQATQLHRMVKHADRYRLDYNANIQNVKRDHFEFLLYGVLYSDLVVVFQAPVDRIKQPDIPMWSDKHGRYDALGKSGQFNINKNTVAIHEERFLQDVFDYGEVADVFARLSGGDV
jgi:hypothetical protein